MVFEFFKSRPVVNDNNYDVKTGVIGLTQTGRAQWSSRQPQSLTRTGYLQNPIAFRAVRMIVEAASSLNLILQDKDMRYVDHQLIELLNHPNSGQARMAFFDGLYSYFLLFGDSYIEAKFDEAGDAKELYLLRPDRVQVILGRDGWPKGYEYKVGQKKWFYEIRDRKSAILHVKSFHPQDDHYGLSPLQAAAKSIDVHNSAGSWSKALLDNAARPSGAIVYKGSDGFGHLSKGQYDRLLDELESNHQGAQNAGRPLLLEGGLEWKPMGFSPSDMEFHRTKDTAAREIALAFGVPPMLLGIPGDNTYSNYQEANRAFYRTTVLPLANRVISSLNGWLLSDVSEKFQIDMESLPALESERESDWRRISSADFLSETEKRQLLGFPAKREEEETI